MMRLYRIEPLSTGEWKLVFAASGRQIDIYPTVETAKKAADNLSRETIYYNPYYDNDTAKEGE